MNENSTAPKSSGPADSARPVLNLDNIATPNLDDLKPAMRQLIDIEARRCAAAPDPATRGMVLDKFRRLMKSHLLKHPEDMEMSSLASGRDIKSRAVERAYAMMCIILKSTSEIDEALREIKNDT